VLVAPGGIRAIARPAPDRCGVDGVDFAVILVFQLEAHDLPAKVSALAVGAHHGHRSGRAGANRPLDTGQAEGSTKNLRQLMGIHGRYRLRRKTGHHPLADRAPWTLRSRGPKYTMLLGVGMGAAPRSETVAKSSAERKGVS